MKKTVVILLIAALALGATALVSCKKKAKDPAYPQLVGSWKGLTSQYKTVKLQVENIGGDLYITSASLVFSIGETDSTSYSRTNSGGLALLSGTSFSVVLDGSPPSESYLQGTFQTDTLKLSGTFTAYSSLQPGIPVTGTFKASKISK